MAPSTAEISAALRDVVAQCFKRNDMDSLTLKRVRAQAAQDLDFDPDFFKTNNIWSSKSKALITKEVERQERAQETKQATAPDAQDEHEDEDEDLPTTGRARSSLKAQAHQEDSSSDLETTQSRSKKRKSLSISKTSKPRKRQKSSTPELDQSDTEGSNEEAVNANASSTESDDEEETSATKPSTKDNDDSEMSDVLDDTPPPKRKKRSSPSTGDKVAKDKVSRSSAKTSQSTKETGSSPQDEEIKKLQGWLVKCGIRKVWGSYLKPYSTPKEKISHLRGMLKEAGMDGRYSVEKARKIKEQRELAADLEAVQEGEKNWGVDDEEESKDGNGRPRRRLAKGLAELARFDDSETSDD